MDAAELKRFFTSEEGASAVREEEQRARMLGISGVPLYVINEAVRFLARNRRKLSGSPSNYPCRENRKRQP